MLLKLLHLCVLLLKCDAQQFLPRNNFNKMKDVFTWKQITLDLDGVFYTKDSDYERKANGIYFDQELEDYERFFIQYNNVPVGFAVDEARNRVFITIPRRRYAIPSTLNYVSLNSSTEPMLKPYPSWEQAKELVSVYRPRIDSCNRLWMVDTGLLEIPDNRQQKKPPAIVIYDLNTDKEILRHELDASVLTNETTTGGLTSITVDVTPSTCDQAFAYINDLATDSMIVFSLQRKASWNIKHKSFSHDLGATDFKVLEFLVPWKDGLFSIALSEPDETGNRKVYYHPLVATQEFSIDANTLKNRGRDFDTKYKLEGVRGAWSQSGSHDYHPGTRTMFYANVAQNAIQCWNVDKPLASSNVAIAAQDFKKLVYVSDLKVVGDEVWVLANQMPKFVYGTLDYKEFNFFLLRATVNDLIYKTVCENNK